jgi:di/tricarboxylate transporter
LLTIAAAFGLGNALQASGAADVISNTLVTIFSTGGRIGVLAGLYFTTVRF